MKKTFLITSLAFALASCASTSNNGASNTGVGTYYANLPCKKCNSSGVVIDLVLEPNKTYSMIQHPKNSNEERYESGTWMKEKSYLKLTKNASPADTKAPLTVAIEKLGFGEKMELILLNDKGIPYSKDAERYTFDKK